MSHIVVIFAKKKEMTSHLTYLKPKTEEETNELLMGLSPNEIYERWVWCDKIHEQKVYHRVMGEMREAKKRGSKKLLALMDSYYNPKQSIKITIRKSFFTKT